MSLMTAVKLHLQMSHLAQMIGGRYPTGVQAKISNAFENLRWTDQCLFYVDGGKVTQPVACLLARLP